MIRTAVIAALVGVLLAIAPVVTVAQKTTSKTVEERLKELEERVKVLEDRLAKAEKELAAEKTEKVLFGMRDSARISYARNGSPPETLHASWDKKGCDVASDVMETDNYKVHDAVYAAKRLQRVEQAAIVAEDKINKRFGILVFPWARGEGDVRWFDTLAKLKEASPDVNFGEGYAVDKDKPDPYVLYKKKGRKWTAKTTTKLEGMDDIISYFKAEVIKVGANSATVSYTVLDKDRKPMAGLPANETEIEFREAEDDWGDRPEVKTTEETIKVEAGEFECTVTEVSGTKSWMSKKYPGLLVKMESGSMTTELIEYVD